MKSIAELTLALCLALSATSVSKAQDVGVPDTIRAGFPGIVSYPDSLAVPIYIWNDEDIKGFSLGFTTGNNCEQISSVNLTGSVIPAAAIDSFYVSYRPDLHTVLTGWVDFTTTSPIPPSPASAGRLLMTLYLRFDYAGCEQHIVIDSTYVPPAGLFLLVAGSGFTPQFRGVDLYWDDIGDAGDYSTVDQLPMAPTLDQNTPNPFNSSTAISFEVPRPMTVRLEVFNLLGEQVVTLLDGSVIRGIYQSGWDGRDLHGVVQPSGVYFFRISTDAGTLSRKMMFLK